MGNIFTEWLEQFFDEVDPKEFYRDLFPEGELDIKDKMTRGAYTAIALCISNKETRYKRRNKKQEDGSYKKVYVLNDDGLRQVEPKVYRFTMTDDLELIDDLTKRDDLFCLMSPITYAGKERSASNARFMYAMVFDLDNIRIKDGKPIGLMNLWEGHIGNADRIPKPTYIVSSGNGLHLYYVFERPIPLFPNVVKQLQKMKYELTEMIWNEGIVDLTKGKIQQEGIFQGFRVVGTRTKLDDGSVARAFLTGERTTIEKLNEYVDEPYRVTEFSYKSHLTKAQAKEQYPEWYEERIEKGNKGVLHPWAVNRALYDWWKREILKKATVGHRYYCMMILAALAMKCSFLDVDHIDPKTGKMKKGKNPNPVTREELESDAFEIMEHFEEMTVKDDNHFDEADVLDALDAYDWGMLTFPRGSMAYRGGFIIEPSVPRREKGKRLKQADHLEEARAVRDLRQKRNGTDWRDKNGRKPKYAIVQEWRANHLNGTKAQCIKDTGLSKPTVYKWWDPASKNQKKPAPKSEPVKIEVPEQERYTIMASDGKEYEVSKETYTKLMEELYNDYLKMQAENGEKP